MIPFARATHSFLTKLIGQALESISGVPDDDLNDWRPALGLEDINTFYALMTHLVSAGEYWILHGAAGKPTDRNRPAEFRATGERMALIECADRWMTDTRAYLETLTEDDLTRVFERGGSEPLRWTVAECIVHAVEHTAVHVGHLQLQRQIWNAEHRASSSS
jgi:uncharacterized damage-inducible protein DinB